MALSMRAVAVLVLFSVRANAFSFLLPTASPQPYKEAGRRWAISSWRGQASPSSPPFMQQHRYKATPMMSSFLTDLTVEQANRLSIPFFITGFFPWALYAYKLNGIRQCPRGVAIGYSFLVLFGLLAGPTEALSQSLYGVSFFDCDWIHGTISSVLATSYIAVNLSFLRALRNDGDFPARGFCTALTAGVLVASLLQFLTGGEVHSPYLNGLLDKAVPLDTLVGAVEPVNALSTNSWFNHILELTQNQMSIRLAWRWGQYTGNRAWESIAWGLVPLQFSSIAIATFHLFYNQIPVLLLAFAVLLLVGSSTVAYAALQLSMTEQPIQEGHPFGDNDEWFDDTVPYLVKALGVGLAIAFSVKYASLAFLSQSALQHNTAVAVGIASLLSVYAALDLYRLKESSEKVMEKKA